MKKSILLGTSAVLVVLTGCTTVQYTARQTTVARHDIQATPTVVDITTDYAKRVEASSDWQMSKEDAMNECRFRAITENDIDIVVDPIFKIERKAMKRRSYKATLTGYAGYYTNPRTLIQDIKTFKDLSQEDIEKYLMVHNPEILQYLQGQVVNINHYNQTIPPAPAPAPVPCPAPCPAPVIEQPQPQPEAAPAQEPAPHQEAPAPAPAKTKKKTNRYSRGRS